MTPNPPPSINNFSFNLFALSLSAFTFLICYTLKSPIEILILCSAIAYSLPLLIWEYKHTNKTPTKDLNQNFSWKDVILKLIGFIITISFILFLYWLFPEYQKPIYNQYWNLLAFLGIATICLAPPYFILMQRKYNEKDAYWLIGKCIFFELKSALKEIESPRALIKQYCLAWLVKAFFLPVMYIFFFGHVYRLLNSGKGFSDLSLLSVFSLGVTILFLIDLFVASLGYLFTFKLFNTQIRSTDPTLLGWVVCLLCYHPFSDSILVEYIADPNVLTSWSGIIKNNVLAYCWVSVSLLLLAIYALSTVAFGLRFSNLTHRGILTNGPYRFSKHPAYVAKNIFWWLSTAPYAFIATTPIASLKAILFLLAINLIYYLRAKTEERHLSGDPVYVEYALWMNEHGLFAPIGKYLPFMHYRKS